MGYPSRYKLMGMSQAALPDVVIDGYRDLKLIASGRDSTVYRARQIGSDRTVAIKVLAATPDSLELAVRLGRSHPHIMAVHDTRLLPDGRACVIMDHHEEGSLYDRVRTRGPLPHPEVIAIGVAIADALAYAHGQGVAHGDVKPQKVFALGDSYVLAGFGLPPHAPGDSNVVAGFGSPPHAPGDPNVVAGFGSPPHTPGDPNVVAGFGSPPHTPEDSNVVAGFGLSSGATGDIYALGSTLSALADLRHAPAPLAAVITRCRSDRPQDRFPDAASLRDALSALQTSDQVWAPLSASPGVWMIPAPRVAPSPDPPALAIPYEAPAIFATQPEAHLAPPTAPIRPETPAAPTPARSGPSWPRLVALAGISILLGGLPTLGLAWVRGLSTAPAPVPSLGGLPSIVTGSGRVNDPSIAPQITDLTDRGTSLVLTWTDASGGKALFAVVEVTGAEAVPLIQVGAGRTSVVVERIDPARPYCLAVLAVTETAQAISTLRCTGVRGTLR